MVAPKVKVLYIGQSGKPELAYLHEDGSIECFAEVLVSGIVMHKDARDLMVQRDTAEIGENVRQIAAIESTSQMVPKGPQTMSKMVS